MNPFPFPVHAASADALNEMLANRNEGMRCIAVTDANGRKVTKWCKPEDYDTIKAADEAFQKALTLTTQ